MTNLSDLEIEEENPDPDCAHTETVKKFSGSELCAHCSKFLSYWSGPRRSYPAVQNPDGTFRLT
jgi:hypothetical protein